jgi:hypothetical protein
MAARMIRVTRPVMAKRTPIPWVMLLASSSAGVYRGLDGEGDGSLSGEFKRRIVV